MKNLKTIFKNNENVEKMKRNEIFNNKIKIQVNKSKEFRTEIN